MHNPTSGTKHYQNRYGRVRRSVRKDLFLFRKRQKPLSQNGKLIVLKPEQEAVIRVQSVDRMSLQSIYQILLGDYMVTAVICMSLRR